MPTDKQVYVSKIVEDTAMVRTSMTGMKHNLPWQRDIDVLLMLCNSTVSVE